jgi:uncharacterized repeat protein (TIGR01451 family)
MSVTADLVRSFGTGGLHNDGQVLTLTNVAGNVIDLVNSDGGGWPAGTSTPRVTMERIDPTAPGDDANWADNNGFLTYGWDANGDPLNGTARIHNSVYDPPPLADLHVSQNGPGSVTAGESVTYTLLVQNLGTYTAAATLLTDTLNYYPIPSSTVLLKQEYRQFGTWARCRRRRNKGSPSPEASPSRQPAPSSTSLRLPPPPPKPCAATTPPYGLPPCNP